MSENSLPVSDYHNLLKRANLVTNYLCGACFDSSIIVIQEKKILLESKFTADLDTLTKAEMFEIFQRNMKCLYEKTWGWDSKSKKKEIFATDSKFLVLTVSNDIIAWVMFKFEWDDMDEPEFPVLYVYEMQIKDNFRNMSIGSKIINILLQLCKLYKMSKLMLTCLKENTLGMNFYKKNNFLIDCNSPSSHGHDDECYEILSITV